VVAVDTPRLGTFPLKAGESTVKVAARPRLGVWHVLSFYQRDGEWKIECRRAATGQVRYFGLGDLAYVRPTSRAGKAATHDRDCDRVVAAALIPAKPIGRKRPRKAVAR
jgi:hypothetical protein